VVSAAHSDNLYRDHQGNHVVLDEIDVYSSTRTQRSSTLAYQY
jgi:hypothetical protein